MFSNHAIVVFLLYHFFIYNIVLQRFLHVAHVQLYMLFVFRITHNIIHSVSYIIYVNYIYSNLFILDIVHIPLYGITALYCFMQPVTSSAVARRRGGGLRCWSGFWVSCGWRVLHPRVCLRACVGWRGAARAPAPLPSTPCSCVYCTFYICYIYCIYCIHYDYYSHFS